MAKIEFIVLGSAPPYRKETFIPKGGKYPIVYTSKKIKEWKAIVRMTAQQEVGQSGWKITDEPVRATVVFGSIKPKSWKKTENIPKKKPDVESLFKSTLDALEGVIYTDDARICQLFAFKLFTDKPFCYVKVEELCQPEKIGFK
jgi:Holliday junction resolvase RusA-like endonuclease